MVSTFGKYDHQGHPCLAFSSTSRSLASSMPGNGPGRSSSPLDLRSVGTDQSHDFAAFHAPPPRSQRSSTLPTTGGVQGGEGVFRPAGWPDGQCESSTPGPWSQRRSPRGSNRPDRRPRQARAYAAYAAGRSEAVERARSAEIGGGGPFSEVSRCFESGSSSKL